MRMIVKWFVLIFVVVFIFPRIASAAIDLRFKLGSAAGAEKIEAGSSLSGTGNGTSSSNGQVEVVLPASDAIVGYVTGFGIFHRKHSGQIDDLVLPTKMDYEVIGISVSPGFRIRASNNFNFELKLELGYGKGELTLESPYSTWNETKRDIYTSGSLIAGWYYAFDQPGLQLGLELGVQSFSGKFKIWSNLISWDDGTVRGTDGVANLVLGMRF